MESCTTSNSSKSFTSLAHSLGMFWGDRERGRIEGGGVVEKGAVMRESRAIVIEGEATREVLRRISVPGEWESSNSFSRGDAVGGLEASTRGEEEGEGEGERELEADFDIFFAAVAGVETAAEGFWKVERREGEEREGEDVIGAGAEGEDARKVVCRAGVELEVGVRLRGGRLPPATESMLLFPTVRVRVRFRVESSPSSPFSDRKLCVLPPRTAFACLMYISGLKLCYYSVHIRYNGAPFSKRRGLGQ